MPTKRAVRKRAPSTTNLDSRVAKKGKNKDEAAPSGEESAPDDSAGGDVSDPDGDDSSFEADEEEEDGASDDESAASSYRSDPPAPSKRTSRNAAASSRATPQKRGRKSVDAPEGGGSGKSLPAGLEVRFKRPQARKAGSTPYMDGTVHPNTFLFLEDLAANNRRDWLKANDPDFRASLADFHSFVEELSNKIIEVDDTIPELPLKDIVFKIYRDVRFSKDKTPYKTNFSAAWSRTGKKGAFAVYYFQIKPGGGSMLAGGLWHPDAQIVTALRQDIDQHPDRFKGALQGADFRKEFLGGVGSGKKAVDAFIAHNKESALKTKPKGYDGDHPDIALLRLRSFTVHRKLDDDEILGAGALENVARLVGHLVPFITYLNSVVMPDDE